MKRKFLLKLDIQRHAGDPGGGDSGGDPPKTFTQEELDRVVADRIARERKKYADYDDLKTKSSEYEKLLEEQRLADLGEKEKLEAIAKKHEEEKLLLSKQLQDLTEKAKAEKIRSEFVKLATSNQIGYLDDAFNLADLSAVTIDEDGKVSGMEEAIKALVESKPFLVAKKQKSIGDPHNGGSTTLDKTAEQLLKDAAAKAKASGRIEDKMAYAALKAELNK
ncbi:MAG: hypothetical protein ACQEW2_10865 [Bacillota bacterium]